MEGETARTTDGSADEDMPSFHSVTHHSETSGNFKKLIRVCCVLGHLGFTHVLYANSAQASQGQHFLPRLEFPFEYTSRKAKSVVPDQPVQSVQAHPGPHFTRMNKAQFTQNVAQGNGVYRI